MEDRTFAADDLPDLREPLLRFIVPAGLVIAVSPAPTFAQGGEALLPELSVVAEADPAELRRNAAAAKIVFGREDIEAMDAASVGDLLRKLPGTGQIPDMEGKRGRGKSADKLMPLILVDGEPLPGGERNPATALRLAPELIDRIEVIRNGGAEYPAAGPGGIINLVLRDVPPRPSGSLRGGLGAQDGGLVARADGQYGERAAGFGWLMAGAANSRPLAATRSEDIQTFTAGARSGWTLEHAVESGREHSASLSPRFTWTGGGTQFILSPFLALNRQQRDTLTKKQAYAVPAAGTGLAPSGEDAERESGRRDSLRLIGEWRALGGAAAPWAELSLRLLLAGEQESKRQQRREFNAAGAQTASRDEDEQRREAEAGLVFKGKRLLGDSHVIGLGAELKWKSADDARAVLANGVAQALGGDAGARQTDRRAVLWAQDEWQLADAHLLTPGLRLQAQSATVADGLGAVSGRRTRSADPSLHYLFQPTPAWNLRASLARHDKAPGLKDLSSVLRTASGTNSSANPDKAGNPQLGPARTLGIEAGVEHFLDGRAGSIGLSVFQRRIEGQVQKLTRLEGARWVERPYNVGTAWLDGGMLDFKARLDALGMAALTLRGNYAVTHTRLTDSSGFGAGEGPRTSWNLGAEYDWSEQRLSLGGHLSGSSAIDRENSTTLRQTQGARRQIDLYARKKLDRQLALRLSITNLTQPDRLHELLEVDSAGRPARLEHETESSATLVFLALEGKW